MKVGDMVRIVWVPEGHGLGSLIGQAGIIMPTPTSPPSWDAYVNVLVESRIQVMYRNNLQLIQGAS